MTPSQRSAAPRGELWKRIVSATVLAPVALLAVALGGIAFMALVALIAIIAFLEWTSITGSTTLLWARAGGVAFLVAGLAALALGRTSWAIAAIAGPALVGLAAAAYRPPLGWMGLGFLYVGIPCAAFVVLRQAEPFGWTAILWILVVVWATDIAAYFGGRALGGPKLWPRVSPNKTWSGAVSGLAAAMAAGGLTIGLTRGGHLGAGILLAVPLSIAAQAGDLFESAVKRRFGVKDSGQIIPGHGGVLDRVDGLFGAAALALFIAALGLGADILALPSDASAPAGGGT